MLFDMMCKIVERNKILKNIKPILNYCKIFLIDDVKECTADQFDQIHKNFILPYSEIVITGKFSEGKYLYLIREGKSSVGFEERREIISLKQIDDLITLFSFDFNENKNIVIPKNLTGMGLDVNFGTLYDIHNKSFEIKQTVNLNPQNESKKHFEGLMNRDLNEFINLIYHISYQKNFILKETPKRVRKSTVKIPRTHERPLYTILRPKQIRKKMKLPHQGGTKCVHERRAHLRSLTHPRYARDEDGNIKVIKVKSTWIGPTESNPKGNKTYKVILDPESES